MVSSGSPAPHPTAVAANSTTTVPGTRRVTRDRPKITASEATAVTVAAGEKVAAWAASASIRPRNSPGSCGTWSPKKSLICVLAMITAMPFVKPITTGRGM
jgi:hypothetical protein